MLEGLDVSQYQGQIDWGQVAGSGRSFAFIRTGDGVGTDSMFATNWLNAKNAGLIVGAYHFLRPGLPGSEQADVCLNSVGTGEKGELPVTIDVETAGDPASLSQVIQDFNSEIASRTGQACLIYTAPGFWGPAVAPGNGIEGQNPLWVANWEVSSPNLPRGWSNWNFWQYTSTGTCPGIQGAVDLDRFNGSSGDLRAMAGLLTAGKVVGLAALGAGVGMLAYEGASRGLIPSWSGIRRRF